MSPASNDEDDVPFKDRAKHAAYCNARNLKVRAEWFASQGGRCVKCGSTERLECDHIDRTSKTGRDAHKVRSWSLARRVVELAKYQVLCHECHLTKTIAENKLDPSKRAQIERDIYKRHRTD